MWYAGDPAATTGAVAALLRSGLRVLAIASGAWPLHFAARLNATWPTAVHTLTVLTLPTGASVSEAACLPTAVLARLAANCDLVLVEPGLGKSQPDERGESLHMRHTIAAVERILHATLSAMAVPSAALIAPPAARPGSGRDSEEEALLDSPTNALSVAAQFFGLPLFGPSSVHSHSSAEAADPDEAVAKAAIRLLKERAAEGGSQLAAPRAGRWRLPSRSMIVSEAGSVGGGEGREAALAGCPTLPNAVRCGSLRADGKSLQPCPAHWGGSSRSSSGIGGVAWARQPIPLGTSIRLGPCQNLTAGSSCPKWTANMTAKLLPARLLQRTRANEGDSGAWTRVVRRLERGDEVHIVVLGGSMSGQPSSWVSRVTSWMQSEWPGANVVLHNRAVGATGSAFFAMCAETVLPPRADLVMLEHALNDGEHAPAVDPPSLRARAVVYEVLVRGLLRRSPPPALLFLNWDRLGWCSAVEANPTYAPRMRPPPLRGVSWLITPQVAVDLVARWYSIPSLAPRNAIWHRDCDDLRFRGSFCDHGGPLGCGHLTPFGHELVAHVVTSFLSASAAKPGALAGSRHGAEAAASSASAPEAASRPLPRALFASLARSDFGGTVCARGGGLDALPRRVERGADWQYVLRDPGQPAKSANKPGLLSLSAPSSFELDVGEVGPGGIALGYLHSYYHAMGVLNVSCAAGCSCAPQLIDGWAAKRDTSVTTVVLIRTARVHGVGGEGRGGRGRDGSNGCTLRMAHLKRAPRGGADAWSSGTSKFKLVAVIVPPFQVDPKTLRELANAAMV